MKTRIKGLLACLAAGTLVGCASGGGSGGSGHGQVAPPPAPSQSSRSSAQSDSSPCGTINGQPVQCVPTQRAAIDAAMAQTTGGSMPYAETFEALGLYPPPGAPRRPAGSSVSAPAEPPHGYVRMDMYYEPNTVGTIQRAQSASEQWSAAQGAPIEWPAAPPAGDPKALNPFTKRPGDTSVHSAAFDFDLRYQSFGAWNDHAGGFHGYLMAWSQGQTTPGHAVPKTGSATFTGKLIGFYVAPTGAGATAGADVTVNANFSSRSLGFASSGTTVQGSAAPQLDLRGTLTYAPGQASFSGAVVNAGGSMTGSSKGQFYGPNAEELGGAFRLQGAGNELFTGGFGAKR